MEPFIESEMRFGPYPSGHGFQVDDSAQHRAAGKGVKMIDFYKLDTPESDGAPSRLWLVEAKRSTPHAHANNYAKALTKLEGMKDNAISLMILWLK